MNGSSDPTAPRVLAMLIADSVLYDQEVNKYFVIGTYSTIRSFRFPAVHDKMAFYLALDYLRGDKKLKLRLIDSEESLPPLFEGVLPFESSGPMQVVELAFRLPHQITFPTAGEYRAELHCDDVCFYSRRFTVVAV